MSSNLKDEDLKEQLLIYAEAIKKTSALLGKEVVYEKLGSSLIIAIHGVYEEGWFV